MAVPTVISVMGLSVNDALLRERGGSTLHHLPYFVDRCCMFRNAAVPANYCFAHFAT